MVQAGKILTPVPSATASLIVWMLSKCITSRTSTPCARRNRSVSRRIERSSSNPMNACPSRSAGRTMARDASGCVGAAATSISSRRHGIAAISRVASG